MQGLSPVERERRELLDDVYISVCVAFIRNFAPGSVGGGGVGLGDDDVCFFLLHQHYAVHVCQWSDSHCTCVSVRPHTEHASITERDVPQRGVRICHLSVFSF